MFNLFVVAARLFLVFASIHLLCCWSAHNSLAPRTRTLLGVLGQATLIFVAVATLLFFSFCECPKFFDLVKQQRKIFVGIFEVGKIDFALYFSLVVRLFLCFFLSSAAIARRQPSPFRGILVIPRCSSPGDGGPCCLFRPGCSGPRRRDSFLRFLWWFCFDRYFLFCPG